MSEPTIIEEDPFHYWFGLTYSSYLVLPRLMLESMPKDWQRDMIALLEEIPETLALEPKYSNQYGVNYKVDGKFAKDPYRDYRHSAKIPRKDKDE